MSGFDSANRIERIGMQYLSPFLAESSDGGRYVLITKGPLAKRLQESVGDALLNTKDGRIISVEVKCEQNASQNLFLEVWSNRNLTDRSSHGERGSNPGWLLKSSADYLFYYFIETDDLYVVDNFRLKQWAFVGENTFGKIAKHPMRCQKKYSQFNDTWGVCVPIRTLFGEMSGAIKLVHPRQISLPFVDAAD